MKPGVLRRASVVLMAVAGLAAPLAQQKMPTGTAISGVPLPATDLPAGTVSVRLVRGEVSVDKNIVNQSVDLVADGVRRTQKTDATGHVTFSGLKPGAKVQVSATVDGERLTSQDITMDAGAIRFVLVATDPEMVKRAEEDRQLAAGPPVAGSVVLDADSRIVAQLSEDRLNIFYVITILNTARTPVDIGGPLMLDLPRAARGAGVLSGSTPQASVSGARVTVLGPFAPGPTPLTVGFELPIDADTVRLHQVWPATLQAVNVLVQQTGGLDMSSAQISRKQAGATDTGAVVVGTGPAIAAGQALDLDISGLPHHPLWPRYVALALSGVVMAAGVWAAVFPASRRRRA